MINLIKTHLTTPLYLNGYVLVAMRVLSTLFGFIFWALAARFMSSTDVGLASGTLSAAMLLSGIAILGLGYAVVKYLSQTESKNSLVNFSLVISGVISLILALIFLLMLNVFSPALEILRSYPVHSFLFLILVLAWTLSVMLNWIFIATRRTIYSFTRQTSHMFFAIVLVLFFLPLIADYTAAITAHTLAVVISIAWSLYALKHALPGYRFSVSSIKYIFQDISIKQFTRFTAENFASEQFHKIPTFILPLMVINLLGPSEGAYFFIVWTIGTAFPTWLSALSQSLYAEGANDPGNIAQYTYKTTLLGTFITSALVLVIILAGRIILSVYGQEYVEKGLSLLYVVSLAALPAVIQSIIDSFFRLKDRMDAVIKFTVFGGILNMILIYTGMLYFGLIGAGYGLLASQSIVVLLRIAWWKIANPGKKARLPRKQI
jgi:O-antigen/teichoic acid export membrane protein